MPLLASRHLPARGLAFALALLGARPALAQSASVTFDSAEGRHEIFDVTGVAMARVGRGPAQRIPVYAPVCSPTPCQGSLRLGTHSFGVAQPGDDILLAGPPLKIDGPAALRVNYTDKSGWRAAGWLLLATGLGAGLALLVDGGSHDRAQLTAESGAGLAVMTVLPLLSLGFIFQRDSAQIGIAPLAVGGLGRGTGATAPNGAAVVVRF